MLTFDIFYVWMVYMAYDTIWYEHDMMNEKGKASTRRTLPVSLVTFTWYTVYEKEKLENSS